MVDFLIETWGGREFLGAAVGLLEPEKPPHVLKVPKMDVVGVSRTR